jgi:hypothetical protein
VTGPPMPNDLTSNELEKSVTQKADVVNWLRRSLEAVRKGRANTPTNIWANWSHTPV